ncbi:N-acetylmuramoyl-L-alanine amidase, partial [Streptomyces albidoflavus]|nr:N-acetylmuramoyl-L-alanine amidase [Streptomyces albidoflavus]
MTALASAALVLPLLGAAPGPAPAEADTGLRGAFAAAAREYRVPESVLLGVAYLQSRWDTHGGAPSVTGGYGPMHLTDARTALARSTGHHGEHGEDARGDESRPARTPEPVLPSADEELPERLTTLRQAARLSGLPAERLAQR